MNTSDRLRRVALAAVALALTTHQRFSDSETDDRKKAEKDKVAKDTGVPPALVEQHFDRVYDEKCKLLSSFAAAQIDESASKLAGEMIAFIKSAGKDADGEKAAEISREVEKRVADAIDALSGLHIRKDDLHDAFKASFRRAAELLRRAEEESESGVAAEAASDGAPKSIAEHRAKISAARDEHKAAMAEASSRSAQLASLKAELQSLRDANAATSDVDALEAKIAQAESDLQAANENAERAMEAFNAALDAAEAIG